MALGEAFAGAVIQVVVEKLVSAGIGEILKFVKGGKRIDPDTIKNIENNLRMINALLEDAQKRRIKSEAFKIWVNELQDVAYDMDDFLDNVASEAQLQLQQLDQDDYGSMARRVTCLQSARTKVKSILGCVSRAVQRFHYSCKDFPSKIEEINHRLQEIYQQGQGLGLVDNNIEPAIQYLMEATKQISGRETTSLINEPVVFGREEWKRDVIRELLKEEPGKENYVVVPIVGIGGIGKTTLAQYVYNDQQLKDHFKIKAWVCVSDVFDVTRVTTDIIISSKNTSHKCTSLDEAQNALIKVIRDKRFLIVLDDIWDNGYFNWNLIKIPFQYGAIGSKVIVTTRDRKIATMVITNPTHPIFNLAGLSNEDCWRLFQQHANKDFNDLVEMKDDIINKCKGLPLAAKALGGLFRKTMEKKERQMILNNDIWTEEGEVLSVLRLSYYHLPSHLKHTFAFCCIIPKDYVFEEMEVILLWMAQGFLVREKEERFEDVGHLYFQDLVSRSLFERSPSNEKYYVMHDLVHDLAQWAAGDICHCVGDMKDVQKELERTRHLYITSSDTDHTLRTNDESVPAKLRTLICPGEEHIDGFRLRDLITRFRCIRTLVLASYTVEKLPESIGDLKHMRFLDLRFTKIQVLPNSVRKLCNLQVFFLDRCCNLREVTNISFLVKLRHLRFHQSLWEAMPWGFGKLTNLQSLGRSIYLGDEHKNGSIIRELGSLNHLHGELSIIGMQNVRAVDDAREAQLHEKKGLTKLYLKWGGDRNEVDDKNERDVLEALRPATCMEEVELQGYMGMKLPSWLGDGSFKNVVSIKLIRCRKCECLAPLGQLPWLKKLLVTGMPRIRKVGPSAFSGPSCLEELRVVACYNLDTVNEIPFSLVMLKIERCPRLQKVEFKKSLPLTVATSSAPSKATIIIESCESLLTVCRIPLTVKRLKVTDCQKVKYLLFGDMSVESEEKEEAVGGRQEEPDGVGKDMNGISEVGPSAFSGPSCLEELSLVDCDIFDTVNEIPFLLVMLKIERCPRLQKVEFKKSLPSLATSSAPTKATIDIVSCDSLSTVRRIPLTVKRLYIFNCRKVKYLLFGDMSAESEEEEEAAGGRQEESDGVGVESSSSKEEEEEESLLEKQIEIESPSPIELAHLLELRISFCSNFTSLSEDLLLPSVKSIKFSFNGKQEALPEQIHTFTSLEFLQIIGCPNVRRFPKGGLPKTATLNSIEVEGLNIDEPPIGEWGIHLLPHLQTLKICVSGRSTDEVECIPGPHLPLPLHLPSSLSRFEIGDFKNLKSINWACFPNLTALSITECLKMENLGDYNSPPPNLKSVLIVNCPIIQHQCQPHPSGLISFSIFSKQRYSIIRA